MRQLRQRLGREELRPRHAERERVGAVRGDRLEPEHPRAARLERRETRASAEPDLAHGEPGDAQPEHIEPALEAANLAAADLGIVVPARGRIVVAILGLGAAVAAHAGSAARTAPPAPRLGRQRAFGMTRKGVAHAVFRRRIATQYFAFVAVRASAPESQRVSSADRISTRATTS